MLSLDQQPTGSLVLNFISKRIGRANVFICESTTAFLIIKFVHIASIRQSWSKESHELHNSFHSAAILNHLGEVTRKQRSRKIIIVLSRNEEAI